MKLGFVGLGAMGALIVPRLMAAGHSVTGWNRSRDKAAPLIAAGMTWADSPRAVALGPDGILAGLRKGGIYADMSTIAPDVSRAVAAEFAAAGRFMLDSPISGSPVTVTAGNASVMVGGEAEAFER